MIFILLLGSLLLGYILLKRYFPLGNIPEIDNHDFKLSYYNIVDIRDYNESYISPVKEATNIPVAYLNRYHSEIPTKELVVVASSHLEKNVGIRILQKKGFKVIGYKIISHKQHLMNEHIKNETFC